jgi:hypothetical protein
MVPRALRDAVWDAYAGGLGAALVMASWWAGEPSSRLTAGSKAAAGPATRAIPSRKPATPGKSTWTSTGRRTVPDDREYMTVDEDDEDDERCCGIDGLLVYVCCCDDGCECACPGCGCIDG